METIDINVPVWKLTVGELQDIIAQVTKNNLTTINVSGAIEDEYTYGLDGLKDLLKCSKSTAQRIKHSGKLDEAIIQNGRKIIIHKRKALELFNENYD